MNPTLFTASEQFHTTAQRLPPRATTYLNVRSVIEFVAFGTAAIAAAIALAPDRLHAMIISALVLLVCALLVADIAVLNPRRVRLTRFTVTSETVIISRGYFWRREVFLPSKHILNAEIVEGPLLRHFGFTKVVFHSIASSESLSPLRPETVLEIRQAVSSPDDI